MDIYYLAEFSTEQLHHVTMDQTILNFQCSSVSE